MKLFNRVLLCITTALFLFLSGCNSPVYNQTQNNIADVTQRSKDAIKKSNNDAKPRPSLVVNQGLYVDQTPISLAKDPTWLKNRIVLRGDELPFSYYSRTVASGGGKLILTRYQVGLDPSAKLAMSYSGTVKGALDLIAAKTGYVYAINGNDIYWQAFVTKTFSIAFMPGTSDYVMGKAANSGGGGGAASAGGGGSGGGTAVTGLLDDSSSSQYSSLKGTLSVWDDLKATVSQLLSPDGKVMVSQATTSVTIRDRPSNVDLVSKYIKNLNRTLSSQVLVKVEVLDIQLSNDFIFGVNWNAVQAQLGRKADFVFNGDYSSPITISPLTAGSSVPMVGFQPEAGRPTFFGSLINTLQQQGKVSVVSEPRVVCLNNQVSAIRIVSQSGYLASLQNTSFGASGASSTAQTAVTTQITPGTVVTGLTLYVLPKILGNKVYLQVNADLSTLNSIQTINSAGNAVTPTTTNSTTPIIQVPNISQKQFNQRSVVTSGSTLVLSGFRTLSNQTGAQQLFNSQDLGGKASVESDIETIVLITPVVLPGAGVS